jgi:hypothetical protein
MGLALGLSATDNAHVRNPHDQLDWGAVEFLAEIDFIKTAFHMECFGNILLSPRRP